jgi:ABC-type transporter Mla subunit MlaD
VQLRYIALTVFSLAVLAVAIAVIYWIAALQSID